MHNWVHVKKGNIFNIIAIVYDSTNVNTLFKRGIQILQEKFKKLFAIVICLLYFNDLFRHTFEHSDQEITDPNFFIGPIGKKSDQLHKLVNL